MLSLGLSCGVLAQSFEETLDDIRSDFNLVGMATAATCNGFATETYYGGFRNLLTESPIADSTYYRIASISKSFTAAGLMRLYDLGLFELDDDASDALGFLLRNPAHPEVAITYRMLLSHTASIQDGGGYGNFLGATVSTDDPPSIEEILLPGGNFFTSNMWRTEPPGTHFAYSNMTYGVVGTLIEALSGQRFDLFMKTEVLEPLGIPGSFNVADLDDIANLAVLYRNSVPQVDNFQGLPPPPFDGSSYVPGTNGLRFGPQGGLRTTLPGLLTFGNMLVNHGTIDQTVFLDSTTVSLMLADQWTFNEVNGDNYFGLFNSWGLGIHRSLGTIGNGVGDAVIPGVAMWGHPGEAYGLLSDLYIDPETKFVMAFLTNGYLSGGNYDFGSQTTFYAVEEAVFAAVESHLYNPCENSLTVHTPATLSPYCTEIRYNASLDRFDFPLEFTRASASIFGLDGRQVWSGLLADAKPSALTGRGFYVMRVEDAVQTAVCPLKFIIP